jgi:hypothetical protein
MISEIIQYIHRRALLEIGKYCYTSLKECNNVYKRLWHTWRNGVLYAKSFYK